MLTIFRALQDGPYKCILLTITKTLVAELEKRRLFKLWDPGLRVLQLEGGSELFFATSKLLKWRIHVEEEQTIVNSILRAVYRNFAEKQEGKNPSINRVGEDNTNEPLPLVGVAKGPRTQYTHL